VAGDLDFPGDARSTTVPSARASRCNAATVMVRRYSRPWRLLFHVSAIALALLHCCFGLAFPVGREGTAHTDLFFELTLFVPARISAVAFMRLDHSAFTRFAFCFSWHFLLLDLVLPANVRLAPVVSRILGFARVGLQPYCSTTASAGGRNVLR
jgi:hypothetical protein